MCSKCPSPCNSKPLPSATEKERSDDPLCVRHPSDAVRMERFTGPGPYFQCACHRGEWIFLHYMVSSLL